MICNICPRKCSVNRDEKKGYCSSPNEFRIARSALHMWEEPCISGTNGSGTVFFSGCNLKCVYCQNSVISLDNKGMAVSDKKLTELFENLIEQGAHNINLVNPTHYAKRLRNVLSQWQSPVPIVWNTSGYEDVDTLLSLKGLVDVFLTDYKYTRSDKAKRYSNAPDYPKKAFNAIKTMRSMVDDTLDDNGLMKSGVIIRHLILPSNTNSAKEVIDTVKDNFSDTYLSIMAQYIPFGRANKFEEINRRITMREYEKVIDYLEQSGLQKVFIQEMSSADKKYIPSFDFEGIL